MGAKTKIFIVIGLVAVGGLICFSGFETRGLAAGLIIGLWPFMFLGQNMYDIDPMFLYAAVFVACGFIVGLSAWVMEKADVIKRIGGLLTILMIAGSCLGFFGGMTFDEWKQHPAISQATEHSGNDPARLDFARTIQIPSAIAGGIQGFYLTTAIGLLWSLALMARNRFQRPLT